MASPRFIGVRDVVDPYKGLQDSVSKVGDIYRQYDKDVQEAQRLRNEEARQNERLEMARATHQQQQEKYAEEQRRNEVIRGFDPEKQIENYGIPERFIPEINKRDEQVRDYYSRAPLIAAGSGAEGTQARQQVEGSLGTARTQAFDATTAQRQGLEYLISQGVPVADAAALVQSRTIGKQSLADRQSALATVVKEENDYALELAKIQAKGQGSGTSGKTGSSSITPENFEAFKITPEQQAKALKQFDAIIGDGFMASVGLTGDATRTVQDITAAVNTINNDVAKYNEQAYKIPGAELRDYVSFDDAVGWVGATAKVGGDVKFKDYGSMKTYLEDMSARQTTSNVANRVRAAEAKRKATTITLPERILAPPIDDVVLSKVTADYARLFPEVFPQAASAGASTTTIPRPGTDGEVNRETGGTRNRVLASEQQQPISRDVLLPYGQPQTPVEVDINNAVARMAELQSGLANPNLSQTERRELYQEAKTIRDSLRQLPDSDRIFENISGNARQIRIQSAQDQARAQEEQSRRELSSEQIQQLRELLAGNLSPTVRRINEDRLQQLLQAYPDLEESISVNPRSGLSNYEQLRQNYYERYPNRIP